MVVIRARRLAMVVIRARRLAMVIVRARRLAVMILGARWLTVVVLRAWRLAVMIFRAWWLAVMIVGARRLAVVIVGARAASVMVIGARAASAMMLIGDLAEEGRSLAAGYGSRDGATWIEGNASAIVVVAFPWGDPSGLRNDAGKVPKSLNIVDVGQVAAGDAVAGADRGVARAVVFAIGKDVVGLAVEGRDNLGVVGARGGAIVFHALVFNSGRSTGINVVGEDRASCNGSNSKQILDHGDR
jgi:hypothetical protein